MGGGAGKVISEIHMHLISPRILEFYFLYLAVVSTLCESPHTRVRFFYSRPNCQTYSAYVVAVIAYAAMVIVHINKKLEMPCDHVSITIVRLVSS